MNNKAAGKERGNNEMYGMAHGGCDKVQKTSPIEREGYAHRNM